MRTIRSWAAIAAGTALAGALAAGCGSTPGRPGAAGAGRPATATAAAVTAGRTAAGNQALARQEAWRLLALTPVPAGATPLAVVPGFAQPASVPVVASLVDQVRAWRLAMPFGRAAAWLQGHRVALPVAGSGSGTTGTVQDAEYSYRGRASAAWQSAQLDVEVVSAPGGTSVLRADGVVVWLDPAPALDRPGGPRIRVTVAGGCPARDTHAAAGASPAVPVTDVTNHGADLERRLLPAAAPAAGLECGYYGLNGHRFQLRSATRLSAAQARRVAATMAAVPLSHPVGEATGCPDDDGSAEVIALSYAGRGDVDLWVTLNGCTSVSNGFISASTS
jgi:hypothetical protein